MAPQPRIHGWVGTQPASSDQIAAEGMRHLSSIAAARVEVFCLSSNGLCWVLYRFHWGMIVGWSALYFIGKIAPDITECDQDDGKRGAKVL